MIDSCLGDCIKNRKAQLPEDIAVTFYLMLARVKEFYREEKMKPGFLLAMTFSALLFQGCSPCEDSPIARVRSPDQMLEAVSFSRNCGATTDYAFHVAIVKAGSQPDATDTVAVFDHTENVGLRWKNARELHISVQKDARRFNTVDELHGVTVFFH